jgi:hypothetical protein
MLVAMSLITKSNKESVCPHCKEPVNPKATRCPHCQGKIRRGIGAGGVLVILIVGWVLFSVATSAVQNAPASNTAKVPQPPTKEAAEMQEMQDLLWSQTAAGKLCSEHPSWTKDDCNNLTHNKIWVGMSYDMITYLYGEPDSKNVSNYGSGNQYQYCWYDYTPSCFYDNNDDGLMDSYN